MRKSPFIRNPYNYDVNEASDDAGLKCEDKSRTIQSQTDETNINSIVERFAITGEMPRNIRLPEYGDFTGINDFHTAANAIAEAHEAFDRLPAKIRARFNNDPGAFVDFTTTPGNELELQQLGLLPPAPTEIIREPSTPPSQPSPQSAPARPQPPETPSKGDTSKSIKPDKN